MNEGTAFTKARLLVGLVKGITVDPPQVTYLEKTLSVSIFWYICRLHNMKFWTG